MARSALAWVLTIALWFVVIFLHEKSTKPKVSAATHIATGMALHQKGDLRAALGEYEAAARIDPQSALAYYDIGAARYQLHEIDAAEAAYRRCIALNPRNAGAHFNLGYLYSYDRKDHEAALREFKAAADADPSLAKAYFQMGRSYHALGDRSRALASWEIAVRLDESLRDSVARLSDRRSTEAR